MKKEKKRFFDVITIFPNIIDSYSSESILGRAQKKNIILNLATGKGYSVLEIIKKTHEITGEKVNYSIVERRPGDSDELVAVSKLAKNIIDWECEYSDMTTILQSM